MKTYSGITTLVEEVEFSCITNWGTWCALSYIEFRSRTYPTFKNRLNGNCLHVSGSGNSPNNYANVIVSGCDASNNQRWEFNGYGQINHSPSGKCLDMGEALSEIRAKQVFNVPQIQLSLSRWEQQQLGGGLFVLWSRVAKVGACRGYDHQRCERGVPGYRGLQRGGPGLRWVRQPDLGLAGIHSAPLIQTAFALCFT